VIEHDIAGGGDPQGMLDALRPDPLDEIAARAVPQAVSAVS
jgi:hypothetical protein